jgi:sulfite reductase beta subunit-like hemoprotein
MLFCRPRADARAGRRLSRELIAVLPDEGVRPAQIRIAVCYSACARTHTATSGLSALLGVSPHEAEFSLRKVAAWRLGPQ